MFPLVYCDHADCGDPTPFYGVALTSFGTQLGDTATIVCDQGYDLVGSELVTCQMDGWTGTNGSYECVLQGLYLFLFFLKFLILFCSP